MPKNYNHLLPQELRDTSWLHDENLPDEEFIAKQQELIDFLKNHEQYALDKDLRFSVAEMEKKFQHFIDMHLDEINMKKRHEKEIDEKLDKVDVVLESLKSNLITEWKKATGMEKANLRKLIDGMIQIEKDHGLFDATTWDGVV